MVDLVITEITALLLAQTNVGMNNVTFRTGEKYLDENVSPPRVVWVYSYTEKLMPPKKMTDADTGLPISACFTRHGSVTAHIWGISRAQTETILHNVITALHRKLHATITMGNVKWPKSNKHLEHGMFCQLPFEIHIPVLTGFVTVPTSRPKVPFYPGGVPAGAPTIDGVIVDPETGEETTPPTPGTSPAADEVADNPTEPVSPDGEARTVITVVESGAGENETVIDSEKTLSDPT